MTPIPKPRRSRLPSPRPIPALKTSPYFPGRGSKPKLDDNRFTFALGLQFFEAGYFWEAHEVWESLWRSSKESQKLWLQICILITAAHLKKRMKQSSPAQRLEVRAQAIWNLLSKATQNRFYSSVRAKRLRAASQIHRRVQSLL